MTVNDGVAVGGFLNCLIKYLLRYQFVSRFLRYSHRRYSVQIPRYNRSSSIDYHVHWQPLTFVYVSLNRSWNSADLATLSVRSKEMLLNLDARLKLATDLHLRCEPNSRVSSSNRSELFSPDYLVAGYSLP